MSKNSAYLTQRVKHALRTEELAIKDLSLDTLMTAYASVYTDGDAGNDHRITMKIPALATHYAKLLNQDKFVVIRDPFENRQYFIKAYGEDLIAVCYAIGPWSNIYNVKCTSEDTLRALNINTPVVTDLKVIDAIFGFKPRSGDVEDHTPATALITPEHTGLHWQWHTGHKPSKKATEAVGSADEAGVEEVAVAGDIVEAPGAPEGNQMTRAFQTAGHGHSRRQDQRHAQRRAHELNTPSGDNKTK